MPEYTWTLQSQGGNNTGFVVPDEVVASFEHGKRVPVAVTIGDTSWRSTIVSMGGRYLLGVNAAQRAATGVGAGDEVRVTVELDTAPREVEVPEVLEQQLAGDAALRAAWEKLSFTARKEHARQLTEAKTEETRQRRLEKVLTALRG